MQAKQSAMRIAIAQRKKRRGPTKKNGVGMKGKQTTPMDAVRGRMGSDGGKRQQPGID